MRIPIEIAKHNPKIDLSLELTREQLDELVGFRLFSSLGIPPGEERIGAHIVVGNIFSIRHHFTEFLNALLLVEHINAICGDSVIPGIDKSGIRSAGERSGFDHAAKTDQVFIINSWRNIAIRDSILSLYHFVVNHNDLCENIEKVATIKRLVDREILLESIDMISRYFPDYKDLRNAIGHLGERSSSEKNIRKHSVGNKNTLCLSSGDGLSLNWRGRMLSFQLTRDSLEKLLEIKQTTFIAFRKVGEKTFGIDLGD